MRRRALLALVLAVGLATTARAADPADRDRTYALLSLAGDELTIVTWQPSVGSNRDQNVRQAVPLSDKSFDREVLRVTGAAVRRAVPGAKTVALATGDKSLYARQAEIADGASRAAFVGSILKQLDEKDARWLIVVTKHRGDARLRFERESGGSGKLVGLGFYIDRVQRVARTDTGESAFGYIAPYAYLEAHLIDLDSGSVLRSAATDESHVLSAARSESTDPWQALTAEEKVRSINGLIDRGLLRAIPTLVAPN